MQKTRIYKRAMDENLFEKELTVAALSAMGNPLEQLSALLLEVTMDLSESMRASIESCFPNARRVVDRFMCSRTFVPVLMKFG